MADVKNDVKYYVIFPCKHIYMKKDMPTDITFTKFIDDAQSFTKAEALRIADNYGLDVMERKVTTTTEIVDRILNIKTEDK